MAFFSKKSDGPSKLGADYVLWEQRFEDLKAPQVEAKAAVDAQQELAITGQGDPKALAGAKATLLDLDQKLAVCRQKLAALLDLINLESTAILDKDIAMAPAETAALESERIAAGAEMIRAMTRAAFLQDQYFQADERVTEIAFKDFAYGVPPHLADWLDTFKKIFQNELNRLQADEPGPVSYRLRRQMNRSLRMQYNDSNFRDPVIQAIVRETIARARGEGA